MLDVIVSVDVCVLFGAGWLLCGGARVSVKPEHPVDTTDADSCAVQHAPWWCAPLGVGRPSGWVCRTGKRVVGELVKGWKGAAAVASLVEAAPGAPSELA